MTQEANSGDRRATVAKPGSGGPADADGWVRMAAALMKTEKYKEALEMLHLAIQCDPNHGGAWLALAKAYYLVGRLDEATQALDIARQNQAPADRIERYRRRIAELQQLRALRGSGAEQAEVSIHEADRQRRTLLSDGGGVAEHE